MTALPRRSHLPRHTRLFRTCTLAQLAAMPLVDLDVALALLWKRIEAAHRCIPPPRNVPDWKLDAIVRAAPVAALPPRPAPLLSERLAMENDRRQYRQLHAERWHSERVAAEEDAAEQAAADRAARAELEDVAGPESLRFTDIDHTKEET